MKLLFIPLSLAFLLCSGCTGFGGNNGYNRGFGGGYGNNGGGYGYPGPYGYGGYGYGGGYNDYDYQRDYRERRKNQQRQERKQAQAKKELNYMYKNRAEIEKLPPKQQKQAVKRAKKLYGQID